MTLFARERGILKGLQVEALSKPYKKTQKKAEKNFC